MLEVEMKFAAADWSGLEHQLAAWGATADAAIAEEDHYLQAPDRDFRQTDEAFRLRRIGTANYLTYKGPRLDTQTKTRTELEVPIHDGDQAREDFLRLLGYLGYRPVTVVHKTRRIFRLERHGFPLEVCLDDVAEVGRFVELEIVADESQLEAAKTAVLRVAAELGLRETERRSYLQMLLTARGKEG